MTSDPQIPQPPPEGTPPPQHEDGGSGALVGCLLAVVIGGALLFALRFLYLDTPLGDLLRGMFGQ